MCINNLIDVTHRVSQITSGIARPRDVSVFNVVMSRKVLEAHLFIILARSKSFCAVKVFERVFALFSCSSRSFSSVACAALRFCDPLIVPIAGLDGKGARAIFLGVGVSNLEIQKEDQDQRIQRRCYQLNFMEK